MNSTKWRKLSLPVLVLSVALTSADTARQARGSVTPVQQSSQGERVTSSARPAGAGAASGATNSSNAQSRRRRSASSEQAGGQTQYSQENLRRVAEYLQLRMPAVVPPPGIQAEPTPPSAIGQVQPASQSSQPSAPSTHAELRAAWEGFHAWADPAIRRYAAGFGLRGADLDDCAGDVWIDLMRRLPDFRLDPSRGSFGSWLYRVVQSKAMDMKRREARRSAKELTADLAENHASVGGGVTDPAARPQREEARTAVHRALTQLKRVASPRSYQVLQLRQMEGQSVAQVAKNLGLTAEQVWAREHRMKRKLEGLLRAHGIESVA